MSERRGPSPEFVNWTRPAGEPRNSPLPRTAPGVQDIYRQPVWAYYELLKQGTRDETMSRHAGRNMHRIPSHQAMAALANCSVRTSVNRRNRLVESGLISVTERVDEHGILIGSWMSDQPWKDYLAALKRDSQIAKTADKGYVIVRGYRFITPAHAVECEIAHVAVVAPRDGAAPAPVVPFAAGLPDVSTLSAVMARFNIKDQDAKGALELLAEARLQCAEIPPAELAEGLAVELEKRARWKAKKRDRLEVNVPYLMTFIRSLAGAWASDLDERRKEEARAAEQAVSAQRREAELREQQEYQSFTEDTLNRLFSEMPATEWAKILADARRDLKPEWRARMTPIQLDTLALGAAKRTAMDSLRHRVPSFEAWRDWRSGVADELDMRSMAAG